MVAYHETAPEGLVSITSRVIQQRWDGHLTSNITACSGRYFNPFSCFDFILEYKLMTIRKVSAVMRSLSLVFSRHLAIARTSELIVANLSLMRVKSTGRYC